MTSETLGATVTVSFNVGNLIDEEALRDLYPNVSKGEAIALYVKSAIEEDGIHEIMGWASDDPKVLGVSLLIEAP